MFFSKLNKPRFVYYNMKKDKSIHKRADKSSNKKTIWYLVLILILVFFIILFLIRIHQHYTMFRNHEKYFKQPNPQIESWMTVDTLIRYFHISPDYLAKELKVNNTFLNQRLTIDSICKKNHLNCTEVVSNLNLLKP
jgi:hypothetical protein